MARKNKKKKTLSPITVFIILIVGTIILSAVLSFLGKIEINNKYPFSWLSQGSYSSLNSVTGKLETQVIEVESLLNTKGLQYIISNFVSNFVSFAPLGMILIAFIGVTVAEKSGLFKALSLIRKETSPKWVFTFILVLLGVISSLFTDLGYVFLIPLGAIIFSLQKRNPIAGIVAAFAGVAGGYGVSAFVSSFDTSLALYTNAGAQILDSKYNVPLFGNIFYILIATIIISIIGTIITEKIILPKLPNKKDDIDEIQILDRRQKRGLLFTALADIVLLIAFIYMIIPNCPLPGAGLLLDTASEGYINQLLGANSYFQQGLVVIVSAILFISGIAYGLGSKTIKNDNDIIDFITASKNNIGYLIILLFFASQFIAIFKKTNIGTIINISLIEMIRDLNITGLPLVILFFIIIMLGSFLLTSPTLKWSIIAPTIVPIFMQSNISPEFVQVIYRSAASPINILTPLLAYYVIYLAFLQIYNTNDEVVTMKKSFSYMMPYALIFALTFLILIVIWYIIGLPIGPGVYPTL